MAIAPIVIRIFAKNEFSKVFGGVQKSIGQGGKKINSFGKKITAGLTVPLAFAGAASFKMANDFNESMANIGTLIPGQTERLKDLKKEVQRLAIETGKSTADIADGLFQTISAFGDDDPALTMAKLSSNARAAVGGVATVSDALNLTSLATKAFGDTSAATTQKVLNLAFMANKLGQTTFPEMAANLGKAISPGKTLGVTLEEVFAIMGTFTGVTGNTSEVTTQLTGVFGALMKPTTDMSNLFKTLAVKDGAGLIKKFGGLKNAMKAVSIFASKNNMEITKLIGRKEALNLILAANGAQADTFATKLAAMAKVTGVSGEAEEAFEQQANGINKSGFAFKQFTSQLSVFAQQLGDVIGTYLAPFIAKLGKLLSKFQALAPGTKKMIVVVAALAAALGPLLVVLGAVAIAVAAISWPVFAVVAGIAALGAAITFVVLKWDEWGGWIKKTGTILLFFMGPLGMILGAIILIRKNWDGIVKSFKSGLGTVGKVASKIGSFFSGDRNSTSSQNVGVNSLGSSSGGLSTAAQFAAQNVGGGINTNNSKIEVDFKNLPKEVKPRIIKDGGGLDIGNGLMSAGAF